MNVVGQDQKKNSDSMLENWENIEEGARKYIYFCMPRGFVSMAEFVQFVRFE